MPDHKYSNPFPKKMTEGKAVKLREKIDFDMEESGTTKEYQINWVRHGVSCANITSLFIKSFSKMGDTPLFEGSTIGSCYLNKYNRGTGTDLPKAYDAGFVFCSQMLRAIQTAILMFPDKFLEGKEVLVLP